MQHRKTDHPSTRNAMVVSESLAKNGLAALPTISAFEAELLAIDMMSQVHPDLELQADSTSLLVYQPSTVGDEGPVRLVWQTEVMSMPHHVEIESWWMPTAMTSLFTMLFAGMP